MTLRRWAKDKGEDTDEIGPVEEGVRAELEKLGWNPLTPPGPLRTAALRACALAETYDRTMNAAALPSLDTRLQGVMGEARSAVMAAEESGVDPTPARAADPEVADFEERRRRRQRGEESA